MFFFYLYFIMSKTPISWIELINQKIKEAKNQGKAAGVMDVMPEAKSDWKKIKDGSHPKHVQGKPPKRGKTKKRGHKGNPSVTRPGHIDFRTHKGNKFYNRKGKRQTVNVKGVKGEPFVGNKGYSKKTKRCRKGCIKKSRCAKIRKTRKQRGGVGIVGYNNMAHIGAPIDGERPPVGATGEFYDEVDEKAVHPFAMYSNPNGGGKRRKRNTKKQRGGTTPSLVSSDPTSVTEGNSPVEPDAAAAADDVRSDDSEVKTADDRVDSSEPVVTEKKGGDEKEQGGNHNVADTKLDKPGHENMQKGGYKKRRKSRRKSRRKNN